MAEGELEGRLDVRGNLVRLHGLHGLHEQTPSAHCNRITDVTYLSWQAASLITVRFEARGTESGGRRRRWWGWNLFLVADSHGARIIEAERLEHGDAEFAAGEGGLNYGWARLRQKGCGQPGWGLAIGDHGEAAQLLQ